MGDVRKGWRRFRSEKLHNF